MYTLIKKCLFLLDPERAHTITLQGLKICHQLGLTKFLKKIPASPITLMGLTFPNRVGLAAGLDKNADYVDALGALGFGFIEIGTVTPKPQAGNPQPRLFRLTEQEAIINRMGFNGKGIDYVAKQLEKISYRGILGINIGKNRDTPLEQATEDYLLGFKYLAKYASYITINVSSPNTQGLRDLQQQDALSELISKLQEVRDAYATQQQKRIPLLVKISPDLTLTALAELASVLLKYQIDGVIATNTTLQRDMIQDSPVAKETGGLSGRPLSSLNTEVIKQLYSLIENKIPIIASGGIMDKASAQEKIAAGASLLQLYTGLIYRGPGLIRVVA